MPDFVHHSNPDEPLANNGYHHPRSISRQDAKTGTRIFDVLCVLMQKAMGTVNENDCEGSARMIFPLKRKTGCNGFSDGIHDAKRTRIFDVLGVLMPQAMVAVNENDVKDRHG